MEARSRLKLMRVAHTCFQSQHFLARSLLQCRRYLSLTSQALQDPTPQLAPKTPSSSLGSLSDLGSSFRTSRKTTGRDPRNDSSNLIEIPEIYQERIGITPPHHLHVYSTKHNTHISLTRPDRSPIFVVSTGNLGFKKANRGTYDAAYQLGAYTMKRIRDSGLLSNPTSKEQRIEKVELVLRGYGDGREAMKKILLGSEGMLLRPLVYKVTDATRLKFGGTRSKKPRRLG